MSNAVFEQVIHLIDQLTLEERQRVIDHLQSTVLTREMILAEHAQQVANGLFQNVESLRNKYASPDFDLSEAELLAGIQEFANQWEQEFDEFTDHP